MPNFGLVPQAKVENSRTLAAALGITQEAGDELLTKEILVTGGDDDAFREEVVALLERTFSSVTSTPSSAPVIEVVLGSATARSTVPKIYIAVSDQGCCISRSPLLSGQNVIPRILQVIAACYVSAAVVRLACGDPDAMPFRDPFHLDWQQLGLPEAAYTTPVNIGEAYLAGCGAVGCGFVWALRGVTLRGKLHLVDNDQVSAGNLNRQIWFQADDIGSSKALTLLTRSRQYFPDLEILPREARLQDLPERRDPHWLKTLISAVDSPRARRLLQDECPGEVFDASTTDIREVVVHQHVQPTEGACLSCIYAKTDQEGKFESHLAESLGVSLDEIAQREVSPSSAEAIVRKHPNLDTANLVGQAYDSLFKRLCGAQLLSSDSTGRQVLAPLAFVSVLAGALCALELLKARIGEPEGRASTVWRVSPWYAPQRSARRRVGANAQCEFCASSIKQSFVRQIWAKKIF